MQPGQTISGRFRVTREAGRGGMGTVFHAVDLERPDAAVALKVLSGPGEALDEVALGRFDREIECLAALDDPRIVGYVAHGVTDGETWLAEEWVDGESLVERLDADGLDLAGTLSVVTDVARALATAHRAGIVHRDVKPQNILLVDGDPGRVKLIDFGIARRTAEPGRLTRTGTIIGTPGYFSPEQVRGDRNVTPRTDVFALGCVLYECVTGRPPFTGRSITAVRTKVLLYEPPPLHRVVPDLPPALSHVVATMMAKDLATRLADGDAAAHILAELAPRLPRSLPPRARAPAVATEVASPAPRQRAAAAHSADERAALAAVVIASGTALPDDLADTIRRAGGVLEILPGNTALVQPPPQLPIAEQARCAGRCALALRDHLDGPIVVCGWIEASDPPAALASAIDRGASALTAALATDTPARDPVVHVDRTLVPLLEQQFELVTAPDGAVVLRGPRLGPP